MDNIEFTHPKYYWSHTIAPTGLTFYNGKEFPTWKCDILLSGLSRGSLWRIHLENNDVVCLEELTDAKNGKLLKIENAAAKKG